MLTLAKSAQHYFGDHVRGGGKASRKIEVTRIIAFLDWVESTEKVYGLHGLGKTTSLDSGKLTGIFPIKRCTNIGWDYASSGVGSINTKNRQNREKPRTLLNPN